MLRRRRFITGLGSVAAVWPLVGRAQQVPKIYRVGFLWETPKTFPDALEAFRRELHRLGYIEGRNLTIEFRWAEGNLDHMRKLAEELVRLQVDVIVAPSSVYTGAAKQATSTIPIIFLSHADPLRTGHVASLARPGGNVTGFSLMMTETNVKSLELLKEALPNVSRVAVLYEPATPSHGPGLKAALEAGPKLGLHIQAVAAPSAADFETAFATMSREGAQAVLALSTPLFINGALQLAELSLRHKLPSFYGPKQHVHAGGLMSYSPDRSDLWRRGASYVDKVLKGAKPADLAVQQPTRFELVINLKTAKVLGLTLPPTLLARADEVIE
jgi:putative ABC transport system substrate-binding protein